MKLILPLVFLSEYRLSTDISSISHMVNYIFSSDLSHWHINILNAPHLLEILTWPQNLSHAVVLYLCSCKSSERIVIIYALTSIFVFALGSLLFLWHPTLIIAIDLQSVFLNSSSFHDFSGALDLVGVCLFLESRSSLGFLGFSLSWFSSSPVWLATSQVFCYLYLFCQTCNF